jgi:hypothetical protein
MHGALHGSPSSTDSALIQYDSGSLRQSSVTSTFQCLATIVDTLGKLDPSEVSRGTLYCLESNVRHVIASIRYSSWCPAESKEIMLSYLEQGQKYLQEITDLGTRIENYSYLLEQCISTLINAVAWWRPLISSYLSLSCEKHIFKLSIMRTA